MKMQDMSGKEVGIIVSTPKILHFTAKILKMTEDMIYFRDREGKMYGFNTAHVIEISEK